MILVCDFYKRGQGVYRLNEQATNKKRQPVRTAFLYKERKNVTFYVVFYGYERNS